MPKWVLGRATVGGEDRTARSLESPLAVDLVPALEERRNRSNAVIDLVGRTSTAAGGAGRRPRVLVIGINYAPEHTGIAPYTTGMALALAETCDVQVLTTHPHYPAWRVSEGYGGWRKDTVEDGVRVARLRHYVPRKPQGPSRIVSELSFALRCATARVDRRRAPDLVIAVSPAMLSTWAAARVAKRFGAPLAVVVQDVYSRAVTEAGSLGGRGAGAIRSVESRLLRAAESVVTIHPSMASSIVDRLGVEPRRMSVIRNWSHVGAPRATRELTRDRMGWADDEHIVLHAGNMGAKQGLSNVVAAAKLVKPEDRLRFVLMGSGSDRAALVALAEGVDAVDIIDSVDAEVFADVLAAADVLLVNERPGVMEMCVPSKLTSYFAASRPVLAVTEALGATAHEVRSSGAGVVVAPGRPAELVQAALSLVSSPSRDEMGRNGRMYAVAHLSEQAAGTAYREWAARLLGADRAGVIGAQRHRARAAGASWGSSTDAGVVGASTDSADVRDPRSIDVVSS